MSCLADTQAKMIDTTMYIRHFKQDAAWGGIGCSSGGYLPRYFDLGVLSVDIQIGNSFILHCGEGGAFEKVFESFGVDRNIASVVI